MSDVPGIYVIVHVCGKAFAYTYKLQLIGSVDLL